MPAILFPTMPTVPRLAFTGLTAAAIIATEMSWYSELAGMPAIVTLFVSLMIVAFIIIAATLPRFTYQWLHHNNRWSRRYPVVVPAIAGAHAPLAAAVFLHPALFGTETHQPGQVALAAVSAISIGFWVLHEALLAKHGYDVAQSNR